MARSSSTPWRAAKSSTLMRLSSRSGAPLTCCSMAAAATGSADCPRTLNSACASLTGQAYRNGVRYLQVPGSYRSPALRSDGRQRPHALGSEVRTPIDQSGVELHQRGAGLDSLDGFVTRHDAPRRDDRQRAIEHASKRSQCRHRAIAEWRAGKAALFGGMRQSFDAVARERRVRRDHAIDAMPDQQPGNGMHRLAFEVRCNLDDQRHAPAMLLRKRVALEYEPREEGVERLFVLQVAQSLRIR